MYKRAPTALLAFSLFFSATISPASAQMNWNSGTAFGMNTPVQTYMVVNKIMLNKLPSSVASAQAHNHANRSAAPSYKPPTNVPLSATSFKHSGRHIMPERMAATTSDPKNSIKVYNDLLGNYNEFLKHGGHYDRLKNNVAAALTFLVVSSYYAANNGAELSEAQEEAILKDFNIALSETPQFKQMSDAEKQGMSEVCAIFGTYVLITYRIGAEKNQPDQIKTAKEVANFGIQQIFGVPFSKLSLKNGVAVR